MNTVVDADPAIPADAVPLGKLRRFAGAASVLVMATGILVLVGWAVDIAALAFLAPCAGLIAHTATRHTQIALLIGALPGAMT